MTNEELNCLSLIRHAIGDNGLRMQDELVQYINDVFESESACYDALLELVLDMPDKDIKDSVKTALRKSGDLRRKNIYHA